MNLKKYLKIHKIFIDNGISYVAQYRKDIWLNLLINLLWLSFLFITIEIIFNQTQTILGWTKQEVYLLTFFWIIVDELTLMFFGNLPNIPDMITKGEVDFYITKPANSLFLVSTKFFLFRAFYRLLIEFCLLAWVIWKFNFGYSFVNIVLGLIFLLVGIMVNYSVMVMLNTLSFWFMRIDNINDAYETIIGLGKYPLNVFPKAIKIIFYTILPIAFQAYIPVLVISGRLSYYFIALALVFALVIFSLAIKFWNFAIKSYTSASS